MTEEQKQHNYRGKSNWEYPEIYGKIINKTSEDGKLVCSNPSMCWKRKRRLKTGNDFSTSLITRSLLIFSCYRHNPPPSYQLLLWFLRSI